MPFVLAGAIFLTPLVWMAVTSTWADTETPTTTVSSTTSSSTEKAIAIPAEAAKVAWSKNWMAKYVNATPRTDYVHVLIDAETLHAKLEGESNHSAVAREAYNLVHAFHFPENAGDLVKLDIVYFENRDNYGAPLWDSIKRIGHLEFSRKTLAQAKPETFLNPEAEWKGLFQTVRFYN